MYEANIALLVSSMVICASMMLTLARCAYSNCCFATFAAVVAASADSLAMRSDFNVCLVCLTEESLASLASFTVADHSPPVNMASIVVTKTSNTVKSAMAHSGDHSPGGHQLPRGFSSCLVEEVWAFC